MAGGLVEKMRKMMGFEDEDYYEDEYEEEETLEMPIMQKSEPIKAQTNKVVNIHSTPQMKVVLYEPNSYEETTIIVNDLKSRRAVILNLEKLDNRQLARTIFDFLNGAVYALDGSIQKISEGIFILAPSNIDIDGNVKKELENKVLFPWQK